MGGDYPAAIISTISAPMASDAVAAGLGALSTCRALGRAIRRKSCTSSPSGAMACARTPLPPTVRLVLMPCTGRVSPLHILSALADGADGVMVAGCLEGQCHYREGNFNAIDRVKFVQRLLRSVGVEPERARMFTMSAGEPPKFIAAVREMDHVIGGLPPLERSAAPAAREDLAAATRGAA